MSLLREKLDISPKLALLSLSMLLFRNLFGLRPSLLLSIALIFFPLFKINLHMNSCIYNTQPDLSHLQVFRCTCFPFLGSTRTNKLTPKSTLCIFLGYSPMYKDYRCFDPFTSKVHPSPHVRFLETDFSYTTTPVSNPSFLSSSQITLPLPLPPIPTSSFIPLLSQLSSLPPPSPPSAPSLPPSHHHVTTCTCDNTPIPRSFPDYITYIATT